jgi:hypothetical protein
VSGADALDSRRDGQDLGVRDIGDFRYADATMHRGCGDEIWQRELSLHDLRRPAFVNGAIELLGSSRGAGGRPHVRNLS